MCKNSKWCCCTKSAVSGVSLLQRVMACGFFILLRYFLRVDGVLVRLNDTRFYHQASATFSLVTAAWLWGAWVIPTQGFRAHSQTPPLRGWGCYSHPVNSMCVCLSLMLRSSQPSFALQLYSYETKPVWM